MPDSTPPSATAGACSVLASLALALHAATARPRHGSCQALITLTRRPLSVSRALHVLSSCVLCAWRRLPLICLKLLVGVCVRDGLRLAASVCVCRTSAASVELLPQGWRAVASPRWLHVQSCSTWLIVRCCFGGLCVVRDGLAATVCACRTSAASVEPLPRGSRAQRAPSLSLGSLMF